MQANIENISVCIATYQRPQWLEKLLAGIAEQRVEGQFNFSVIVADNDSNESGREVVTRMSASYPVPLVYCIEPRRSIAHVRNMTLEKSNSEFIAFIDDDEFPEKDWLLNLFGALKKYDCAGILGPVRPYYPDGTPGWVRKAGFFERPEFETGYQLSWQGCRTGNVLFKREITAGLPTVFSAEFGMGGSDVDFFRRMTALGHRFLWCNEAVVHEIVPPSRWRRKVLMKRALLRGRNSFRHPEGRWPGLAKAMVAIPLYTLGLPFLLLFGQHLFMRYLIKLCDHVGRALAVVGIEPVKTREM
jgi:glycosyltransferase involved in cell wall biosynthesis